MGGQDIEQAMGVGGGAGYRAGNGGRWGGQDIEQGGRWGGRISSGGVGGGQDIEQAMGVGGGGQDIERGG